MSKKVRGPIEVWFKVEPWQLKIVPLQVVSYSAAFVTYLYKWSPSAPHTERRESRADIFPTFAEAKAEIVKRVSHQIDNLKSELQRKRSELGQWESMQEPQP